MKVPKAEVTFRELGKIIGNKVNQSPINLCTLLNLNITHITTLTQWPLGIYTSVTNWYYGPLDGYICMQNQSWKCLFLFLSVVPKYLYKSTQ